MVVTGAGNTITIDGSYSVATFIADGSFTVVSHININGDSRISGNTKIGN